MKVYLTGPREGFTGKLGNINWVNGEANVVKLSNRMKRQFAISSVNPRQEEVVEGVKEIIEDDGQKVLQETIQKLKNKTEVAEEPKLHRSDIKDFSKEEFGSWANYCSYIKTFADLPSQRGTIRKDVIENFKASLPE